VLILSALLTKHCSGDGIKSNEMSGTCGTYERQERCILEEKRLLGRPRRRCDDNVKMELQ
jgi:hypothetical protein